MTLAKESLPKFKIPKDINKHRWVNLAGLAHFLNITKEKAKEVMGTQKFFKTALFIERDKIYGGNLVDLNSMKYHNKDLNKNRAYFFMQMFDELYFGLDRYLSDVEKAKMMMALSKEGTEQSWIVYFGRYQISMNEKALLFIKHAKEMLCCKSLIENFTPRW